jgi:hypothetical protein
MKFGRLSLLVLLLLIPTAYYFNSIQSPNYFFDQAFAEPNNKNKDFEQGMTIHSSKTDTNKLIQIQDPQIIPLMTKI